MNRDVIGQGCPITVRFSGRRRMTQPPPERQPPPLRCNRWLSAVLESSSVKFPKVASHRKVNQRATIAVDCNTRPVGRKVRCDNSARFAVVWAVSNEYTIPNAESHVAVVEPKSPGTETHWHQYYNGSGQPSSKDENRDRCECVDEQQKVDVLGTDETAAINIHSSRPSHVDNRENDQVTSVG